MVRVSVSIDLDNGLMALASALSGVATVVSKSAPSPETVYWVTSRATDQQLDLPNLQAVIVPWAGVPADLCAQVAARPHLKLYNLHHNALTTAEMAVGLLIAAARGLAEADRQLRQGHWYGRMDDHRNVLLGGKRAVILGYGEIGRHVERILLALGMDVCGIGRSRVAHLDEELARSNALVICAPLTPETRGLIDGARIALLRPPRLLVNVGRGPIVDETALFEACRDRILFAAGIDTWYAYPSPDDQPPVWPSKHPFHELRNVVLSPHRGGDGDQTEHLRLRALGELISDLCNGVDRRAVDPLLGY
ncbi:MAG: hypothetical protein K1X67_15835 [Fimbriimonadaceae bacterium]|nr:hypothetical protein [Fimbriimonadaceae bacterium]